MKKKKLYSPRVCWDYYEEGYELPLDKGKWKENTKRKTRLYGKIDVQKQLKNIERELK